MPRLRPKRYWKITLSMDISMATRRSERLATSTSLARGSAGVGGVALASSSAVEESS